MRVLYLLLSLLIGLYCEAQSLDTSGIIQWSVKVKRTSHTSAIMKITGHVRKGVYVNAPVGTETGVWKRTNSAMTFFFYADSNWHVQATPMGGAIFGGGDRFKTYEAKRTEKVPKITTKSKRIDTVINGKRRQVRYADSSHYPKFRTIVDSSSEKEYTVEVRTSGTIEICRSIELTPSQLQELYAPTLAIPAPTGYVESRKEKKRREKTNNRIVSDYKAKYPRSIDIRIDYEDAVRERYVELVIPFRGKRLKKWYTITLFPKPF